MGYLSKIEDPRTGATLKTFPRTVDTGDTGWSYRNATRTLANIQYGSSPFSGGGKPLAPRKWTWGVREATRRRGTTEDAIRDGYALGARGGSEVRLVYITDDGHERIVAATAEDVRVSHAPSAYDYVDVAVDWEILQHWRERDFAVSGAVRCGQTPTIHCGQTPLVRCGALASVQQVTLVTVSPTLSSYAYPTTYTDATVAGPGGIPTVEDTGPVIELHGPMGGAQGFSLQNFGVAEGCVITFTRPLTEGEFLVMDTGAKSYRVNGGDQSAYVYVDPTQPFDFCIREGSTNPIGLFWYGTIPVAPTSATTINVRWHRFWV